MNDIDLSLEVVHCIIFGVEYLGNR